MTGSAILTLNAGSSSIKFAVFDAGEEPAELFHGQVENLGPAATLHLNSNGGEKQSFELGAADHAIGLTRILDNAHDRLLGRSVVGVGHRIAHGGIDFTRPTILDDDVRDRLRALAPLAPLHQPHNLAAVDAASLVFPSAPQVGCFDTSFHRSHPWVNDTFALPRRFYDNGVRRYGFHGLSYDFVTHELARIAPEIAAGRVVIAHLGNGASMCAVRAGQSVASTMGFSALDGLPMGTRCGQLDPGVLLYLMDHEGMTSAQITDLLYKESGLKGLSGLTHDLRTLEATDSPEARQAIEYFVFRIRREIGAMAAVLGGLDALVFCGGIGENSRRVRSEICHGLGFLGLEIDAEKNAANATRIEACTTPIFVIPTNEERVIARAVNAVLVAPDLQVL